MKRIRLANCVITAPNGQLLLIHRNDGRFSHWELPGGKVEEGESEKWTAVRELQEELGITVRLLDKLGTASFSDKNGAFRCVWFLAEITVGMPRICEPKKFDGWQFFAMRELPQLSLSANMEKLLPKLQHKEIVLTP